MKLFFYLLNSGTSNSLVLYDKAIGETMKMVDFRLLLLENIVKARVRSIMIAPVGLEHWK